MRKKTFLASALLTAAALTLTACGNGGDSAADNILEVTAEPDAKAATPLDSPFTKPDLVLTDTKGKKFDLRAETKGKPTLLYFGYTNCPDVCPLTMGNLAQAKKQLPKEDQDKLQVVLVTTDPKRDTPASLGKWLGAQDPEFIGLTGDFATIQAGARQLGIAIDPPKKNAKGKMESMHGKQVVAFSPKTDDGYVLYNGDTATIDDYAKDLPKLLTGEKP
ncbi:SCO family protein [Streptomyces uncialis]|uniref:SCO family protein n=1 Tax=Streptomyces uncialis TaxID=1048205 RepID=UPI0038680EFC|nr:SCO family protein [Streptomyces uncialis]